MDAGEKEMGEAEKTPRTLTSAVMREMYAEMSLLTDEQFLEKYGMKKPHNILNPGAYSLASKLQILLSGEIVTAEKYRGMRLLTVLSFAVAAGALITAVTFVTIPWEKNRTQRSNYWVRHDGVYRVNIAFAALCALPLGILSYNMLVRYFICRSLEKKGTKIWAPKRKSITLIAMCRLIAQDLNILFWLLQNVYVIAKPCSWFNNFVNGCALVQWSCINFNFILDLVWAECLCPWLDKDGKPETSLPGRKSWQYTPDPIVIDQPLGWRHVWKVVLGLIFQGIIIFYAVWIGITGGIGKREYVQGHLSAQALGTPACYQAGYPCVWDTGWKILVYSIIVMVFLHAFIVFYYIEKAKDRLGATGSYLLWERPHKMLRILESSCGWVTTMGVASTTALFLGRETTCLRMLVPWFGVLPLQVTTSIVACTNAFFYSPRLARDGDVVLEAWLRELVWRAEDVPGLKESIIGKLPKFEELLRKESIFCFDVTAKLLVWSDMVYTLEDHLQGKETENESSLRLCFGLCCPCQGGQKPAKVETGPLQKITEKEGHAQVSQTVNGLGGPAHQQIDHQKQQETPFGGLDTQAPKAQATERRPSLSGRPENRLEYEVAKRRQSLSASRQASDASVALSSRQPSEVSSKMRANSLGSELPGLGVVSLKLQDGYLQMEGTDTKIQISEGVASEAGLGLAMRLFKLDGFEILYEELLQTKVLLGWSKTCLVLAFRGTANATNACTDLKVLRQRHHSLKPGRLWLGTQPLVHGGFLQSWLSDGLNARVMQRVKEIVAQSSVDKDEFNIYITGHSLGGALATLAAVEIAQQEDLPAVTCITFGAPRTGNHAFASAYNDLVPNTWHVINDRDAVPRVGKFFTLFKRPGQRVLINRVGDCRVRPDPIQVSVHSVGFSVKAHLLNAYRKAMGAILKSQLSPLHRRSGGYEAFQAFASDEDMCQLGRYLGLDLKKLLVAKPSEIKLAKRRKPSLWTPVRQVQLLHTLLRVCTFMFGQDLTEALRGGAYRFLPCIQDEGDDSTLASTESNVSEDARQEV